MILSGDIIFYNCTAAPPTVTHNQFKMLLNNDGLKKKKDKHHIFCLKFVL